MKRREDLPELLSPAGSEDALLAAVAGGADAVYLGVSEGASNARTLAENFTREQLSRLIPLAHAHGVRIYVTLNTLTYGRELSELTELAAYLFDIGADGVIVADLGLAACIRARVPQLPLHASTQAFAHSTRSADALAALGFSRVVLARELSQGDIRSVTEHARPETEVFLHGALCVSHSGQCLFSSLVGGRSGNRGACAQPCRLPYSGGYPLSLKDYALARHIPALIDSGVASLKIEGRMKSPAYVYGVTKIYRRLLDERRAATDAEMEALARIFSRDGLTDGYFKKSLSHMGGVRRAEDKAASREVTAEIPPLSPVELTGRAVIRRGAPISLTLAFTARNGKHYTAKAEGPLPLCAQTAALTLGNANERLAKLGGTGFVFSLLDIDLDDGLFLPVSVLNALRRDGVAALITALAEGEKASVLPSNGEPEPPLATLAHTALVYRRDTFAALDRHSFDAVFLSYPAAESLTEEDPLPDGVAIPPVLFDSEEAPVRARLKQFAARGVRYALVSSLGAISLAKECGLIPYGDFRLNIANGESAAVLRAMGLCGFIAAAECTPRIADAIGGALITYGRIPLMITERCFVKEHFGCDACTHAALTDRRGVTFPVLREHAHRCLVLNSLPTYLGDVREGKSAATHMIFTTESPKDADAVLRAFCAQKPLAVPVRRAFKPS